MGVPPWAPRMNDKANHAQRGNRSDHRGSAFAPGVGPCTGSALLQGPRLSFAQIIVSLAAGHRALPGTEKKTIVIVPTE